VTQLIENWTAYRLKPRVRTGPGKPGKSWNFNIPKSRLGNPGKSILVMEVMEN
jgi:hypothetical protein